MAAPGGTTLVTLHCGDCSEHAAAFGGTCTAAVCVGGTDLNQRSGCWSLRFATHSNYTGTEASSVSFPDCRWREHNRKVPGRHPLNISR